MRGSAEYPLPGGHPFALRFTSYLINAPGYLAHLAARAQAAGIPFVRHTLTALDEGFRLPELGEVRVVVNATSLGARTLAGVEDGKVWPARGQTVLVRAPGVRRCIMQTEGFGVSACDPSAHHLAPTPRCARSDSVHSGRRSAAGVRHSAPWDRARRPRRHVLSLAVVRPGPRRGRTHTQGMLRVGAGARDDGKRVGRDRGGAASGRAAACEGGRSAGRVGEARGGRVRACVWLWRGWVRRVGRRRGGARGVLMSRVGRYQASLGVAERVAELVEEYLAEKK